MSPFFGNGNFNRTADTRIDSGIIHINDMLPFATVRSFIGFFQIFYGIGFGNDSGQMEEGSLHNHINASAEYDIFCDFKSINDIKFRMESRQFSF